MLNRTSDPSEIVGPTSIKLMEQDKFVRILDGKIGDCDIAFIDEIYKSNEPTLNIMLSILNEKVVYNDGKPVPIPLKMMIAASNEMPAEGEGLEALHDRILIKHWVDYIKDPNNKLLMMKNYNNAKDPYSPAAKTAKTTITLDELALIQYFNNGVSLSKSLMGSYSKLLSILNKNNIVISDRKVNWCLDVLKAHALLEGKLLADEDDLKALIPVLWERVDDIPIVTQEILKMVDPYADKVNTYLKEAKDMVNKINELNASAVRSDGTTDAEITKQVMELTIEYKSKAETIVVKINDIIHEALAKGKNVSKFENARNTVSSDLQDILQKMLNVTPSNMTANNTSMAQDIVAATDTFSADVPF